MRGKRTQSSTARVFVCVVMHEPLRFVTGLQPLGAMLETVLRVRIRAIELCILLEAARYHATWLFARIDPRVEATSNRIYICVQWPSDVGAKAKRQTWCRPFRTC